MERQLVVFDIGNEHFGVNIIDVDSIIKMQEIISVPMSLNFVEGITTLRGQVLPVIDLRKRLNVPLTEKTNETRIIVINMEGSKVGMIVDAVSEVLTIQEDTIEATPVMVSNVDTAFITGIAKVDSRLIILLDLEKIFSSKEKAALSDM